jgi:hypothetical protein
MFLPVFTRTCMHRPLWTSELSLKLTLIIVCSYTHTTLQTEPFPWNFLSGNLYAFVLVLSIEKYDVHKRNRFGQMLSKILALSWSNWGKQPTDRESDPNVEVPNTQASLVPSLSGTYLAHLNFPCTLNPAVYTQTASCSYVNTHTVGCRTITMHFREGGREVT